MSDEPVNVRALALDEQLNIIREPKVDIPRNAGHIAALTNCYDEYLKKELPTNVDSLGVFEDGIFRITSDFAFYNQFMLHEDSGESGRKHLLSYMRSLGRMGESISDTFKVAIASRSARGQVYVRLLLQNLDIFCNF